MQTTTRSGDKQISSVGRRSAWRLFVLHPAFVPLVVIGAILLRVVVVMGFPLEQVSDSEWYVTTATGIAAGLGYQEGGFPTAYWPVGWPAILAGGVLLLGSMSSTIVVLNGLGALATLLLILWFGRRIVGSEMVARISVLAYALYPNHIAYSGAASTEIVYTALSIAAFAMLIAYRERPLWVFFSGLVFGVATLVKAQTLLFPFGAVIAIALVFRRFGWKRMIRAGVAVYIGLLVVVLPWTYRNFVVFGEPVLVSTNGGTALMLGANDLMTGGHFEFQDTPVFTRFGIPWEDRVERQVEIDRLEKAAALEWIAENTWSYIAWMPRKVLYLWLKDTDGFWSFDRSYPDHTLVVRTLQLVNQIGYMIVIALSLFGGVVTLAAMIRGDEPRSHIALLYCMPVFVTLLAAVFTGQIRYHFPAMPYLILSAAWSAMILGSLLNRARTG